MRIHIDMTATELRIVEHGAPECRVLLHLPVRLDTRPEDLIDSVRTTLAARVRAEISDLRRLPDELEG
jgi:hypothetical protein